MDATYKILGSDGQEYEPVSAEQVKKWIAENRVEKKTPVFPDGARDWVFLESLPEFASAFGQPPPLSTPAPLPRAATGNQGFHAWIGFIAGGLFGVFWLAVIVWIVVAIAKAHGR